MSPRQAARTALQLIVAAAIVFLYLMVFTRGEILRGHWL